MSNPRRQLINAFKQEKIEASTLLNTVIFYTFSLISMAMCSNNIINSQEIHFVTTLCLVIALSVVLSSNIFGFVVLICAIDSFNKMKGKFERYSLFGTIQRGSQKVIMMVSDINTLLMTMLLLAMGGGWSFLAFLLIATRIPLIVAVYHGKKITYDSIMKESEDDIINYLQSI